ncbi:IclR family transcriptional regulator [Bordetella genomosp. 13]|uniref:IclR family transcriptional regulator n=1 Tax=Bordetella genomosp. 13 TaxID=463040 RepID=UPI001642359E|nr:IclR family transcriptional regulator [Bordetella genomosp. 13]
MQIVNELAISADGLSLVQLSERLQLPKTSLFSLLRSLEAGGYVESANGHHRLGPASYEMAAIIQERNGFPANVRSLLEQLHGASEETVMLAVPQRDGAELVYVAVIESDSWLRFRASVGARRPLHAASTGLVMLAFSTPAQQQAYAARAAMEPVTANSLTSRKALLDELKKTRAQGYVMRVSGSVEGATGLGAPVFGRDGALVAAVGLAGLTVRLERNAERLLSLILQAGEQMSRKLGYGGDYPPAAGHDKPA